MSENVYSTGFFAILSLPMNDEDSEILNEKLYDNGSNLRINYEGTLVYSNHTGCMYGLNIEGDKNNNNKKDFIKECAVLNLNIDKKSIKSYNCIWYNGVDSDMAMLELEEYRKKIKW